MSRGYRYGFHPPEILHPWHIWPCADDTLKSLQLDIGSYLSGNLKLDTLRAGVDEAISYRLRLERHLLGEPEDK